MPRTPTLPPTEPAMWRKLLAAAHPDRNGDHDLFVWATSVREAVCEGGSSSGPQRSNRVWEEPRRTYTTTEEDPDRVPFASALGEDFGDITYRALTIASRVEEPYSSLLGLLYDCGSVRHGRARNRQERGASYKQLAKIGHMVGMSKSQRVKWYRIAEDVPFSDKHAGHIIDRLQKEGAAA